MFDFLDWPFIEALGSIVAAIIALFALVVSINARRNMLVNERYRSLDMHYLELQKMLVQSPEMALADEVKPPSYDPYAFAVWNFMESVFDFCQNDRGLRKTWYPAFQREFDLHGDWFLEPENSKLYKDEFVKFVKNQRFLKP